MSTTEYFDLKPTDLPLVQYNSVVFDKMLELVNTQHGLNVAFLGVDWLTRSRLHVDVDYIPALMDEAAELMRSTTQWKFWKQTGVTDVSNMKLELIDMLHFAISESLSVSSEDEGVEASMHEVATEMLVGYEIAFEVSDEEESPAAPAYNFQRLKSSLFSYLSSVFAHYSTDQEGDFEDHDDQDDFFTVSSQHDWASFWRIARYMGVTFGEVVASYLAKVSLNELRVREGDKRGEYQKIWHDGKEDNFFLMEFIDKGKEGGAALGREAIRAWLTSTYASVKAGSFVG